MFFSQTARVAAFRMAVTRTRSLYKRPLQLEPLPSAVARVPVVAQVALAWDMDPLLLVVPVTMASSCAFMLPMATPPNAIVFGSGKLRMATMVQVGVVLNVVAAGLAWLWAMTVLPWWVQLL